MTDVVYVRGNTPSGWQECYCEDFHEVSAEFMEVGYALAGRRIESFDALLFWIEATSEFDESFIGTIRFEYRWWSGDPYPRWKQVLGQKMFVDVESTNCEPQHGADLKSAAVCLAKSKGVEVNEDELPF